MRALVGAAVAGAWTGRCGPRGVRRTQGPGRGRVVGSLALFFPGRPFSFSSPSTMYAHGNGPRHAHSLPLSPPSPSLPPSFSLPQQPSPPPSGATPSPRRTGACTSATSRTRSRGASSRTTCAAAEAAAPAKTRRRGKSCAPTSWWGTTGGRGGAASSSTGRPRRRPPPRGR